MGIDRAVLRDVWRQTQAFFALPAERKLAVAVRRDCYRGYIPLAAFSPNDGGGPPDLYEGYKIHLDLGDDDPLEPNLLATDAIQRLPDGIITFAWEGYRIIQPIGPVS